MKNIFLLLLLIVTAYPATSKAQPNPTFKNQAIDPVLDSILNSRHYTIGKSYPKLSLHHNGQPLKILGTNINSLAQINLQCQTDINGLYSNNAHLIADYFSSSYFSYHIQGSQHSNEGSINGSIFMSAIAQTGEIFRFSAAWCIDVHLDKATKKIVIDTITTKLFPALKNKLKLKHNWHYKIETDDYIETFRVKSNKNRLCWSLYYEVHIK